MRKVELLPNQDREGGRKELPYAPFGASTTNHTRALSSCMPYVILDSHSFVPRTNHSTIDKAVDKECSQKLLPF